MTTSRELKSTCQECGASNLARFDAEIVFSVGALKGILSGKPLYTTAHTLVCLECGSVRYRIPPAQLRLFRKEVTQTAVS